MARMVSTPGWSIDVDQEWIDVTSGRPTADPRWTHTDAAGHAHHYKNGYPTLSYVVDEQHWCNGDEGLGPHDPHWAVDRSHYECLVCGEHITPGTLPPFTSQRIPGVRTAYITGRRADGVTIRAVLTGDEYEAIEADTAAAESIIDGMPDERIVSMEFSR